MPNPSSVPTPAPTLSGDTRVDQPIINPRSEVSVMIRRLPQISGRELYMTTVLIIDTMSALLNGWEAQVAPSRVNDFWSEVEKTNAAVESFRIRRPPVAPLPRVETLIARGETHIFFDGATQAQWIGPIEHAPEAYRVGQAVVQENYFLMGALALAADLGLVLRVAAKWGLYDARTKLALSTTADDADDAAAALQEAGRFIDAKGRT